MRKPVPGFWTVLIEFAIVLVIALFLLGEAMMYLGTKLFGIKY